MFCPKCRDEFRTGFTRCGRCNVDLVDDLANVEPEPESRVSADAPAAPIRMAPYCGYLSLDEAREARDKLREHRIDSDIVVRAAPGTAWDEPIQEEYWLRVDASCSRKISGVLGEVPQVESAADEGGSGFACGDCGEHVAEDETFCPKCGARFDD